MRILITGAAGFIGFHLCKKLLSLDHQVIGLDNINDYYDINLKYSRISELGIRKKEASVRNKLCISKLYKEKFKFINMNLEDRKGLPGLFKKFKFNIVCNLAAQAGVRYSIENPNLYIDSNVVGFLNILECCRNFKVKKFVYASSSSVYGTINKIPFIEENNTDYPISLYAATKKSNEIMAYTYSYLYDIQTLGLRFFTVYGPWGRPDMAPILFAKSILNKKQINVFNKGNLSRDFTYIDDIINGTQKILLKEISKKYDIYNIGCNKPVKLLDFIKCLEDELNIKANMKMLPMQKGDVFKTWSSVDKLKNEVGYNPKINIKLGVKKFIDWYKKYYKF